MAAFSGTDFRLRGLKTQSHLSLRSYSLRVIDHRCSWFSPLASHRASLSCAHPVGGEGGEHCQQTPGWVTPEGAVGPRKWVDPRTVFTCLRCWPHESLVLSSEARWVKGKGSGGYSSSAGLFSQRMASVPWLPWGTDSGRAPSLEFL